MRTDWQAAQRRAAAQLDELVRGLLAEQGRRAWGAERGGSWDIVAAPGEAAWRLYHLVRPGPADVYRYQELGVRATIAPNGELVAFQVDNGDEFLALADTSAAGLRRGLLHLLAKELPVREAAGPPFVSVRGRSPLGWLRGHFRR